MRQLHRRSERLRHALRWRLLLLLCLAGVGSVFAAEPGLRATLSPEQFEAFGLSRLTPAELARLDAWLAAGRPVAEPGVSENQTPAPPSAPVAPPPVPAPATSAAADFGEEQVARERRDENLGERIKARIQGDFEGWEGKTLFRLDNGQIWRQRIGGRYRYRAESPEVEIVKGRFGYYLELVETGRQVGVRRIR